MRMKMASALIAALLVFGLVFGVGQAAAASLPGEPLYGLKLAAEQTRLELTTDPVARADLAAEMAQNRLGEIVQMVADGQVVDRDTAVAAQQQLSRTYQATRKISGTDQQLQAQERFAYMLQNQQGVMASAVNATPQQTQASVQALLRSMWRVRAELQTGTGAASGDQNQIRTNRDQVPVPGGPVGGPGAAVQPDQAADDGLLDATGATTQQGTAAGQGVGPNYGPGSDDTSGAEGPYEYEGDGYGPGPEYGPGPAAPQDDATETPGPFGWLLNLFKKGSSGGQSGGSSSGGSSSGGSSSGGSSSGGSSSGSGSSGSGNR